MTEPPWGECQTAERTWKGPTPKKKRDPHETKDAEAKKRPQTETPQMQAHEDTPRRWRSRVMMITTEDDCKKPFGNGIRDVDLAIMHGC